MANEEANRCFNCGCLAVNSSDVATMLVAYRATVKTNMRTLSAAELLASRTRIKDVLKTGEIVTEIIVPNQGEGTVAAYDKYRIRDSVDFAVTAVASVYTVKDGVVSDASIVLGACAPCRMRPPPPRSSSPARRPRRKMRRRWASWPCWAPSPSSTTPTRST